MQIRAICTGAAILAAVVAVATSDVKSVAGQEVKATAEQPQDQRYLIYVKGIT